MTWAKKYAEFDELRRMATIDTAKFTLAQAGLVSDGVAACHVYDVVVGEITVNQGELNEFFLIDPDVTEPITPEFVEGFVKGAVEVWEEVKDEV